MAGKIYTRTGDRGRTSLFDGKKILKSDKRVETYGTIDELNSAIGLAIAEISNVKFQISNKQKRNGLPLITDELEEIQNDLLEIGSSLAVSKTLPVDQLSSRPKEFEVLIDKLTSKLPPLNQFILPGGGKGGALLHVARTIARRAERRVVGLSKSEKIDPIVLVYLNRLSDLLFTMARFVNYKEKKREKIWRKK
ncbi:MAG: ATP:cob(I)alamin adenosyltransferase [Candidatus Levybacteria bacterium RIFCSPLOWO2_01_FULL_39_10]|nr:MAG: ATP:cob(I)alamin adenosyltransferase [Candidatus Levybacteria bacterium RIFCSPLOWO2_01_FULL_39_10]